MRFGPLVVAGTLAVSIGLAGCGGPSTEKTLESLSGPTKEWYAQAVDEPALRWYTSHDPGNMERAVDAFQETYPGVEVEALRLTSGQLATRFTQELESDARSADVVSVGDKAFIADGQSKRWFEQFTKDEMPATRSLDDQWFDRGVATTLITQYGIAYNTEMVDEAPTGWTDVLESEYKDKIVFADIRNASVYIYHARLWLDTFGQDYLEDLRALDPIVVDSMIPGIQLVASGRAAIGLVVPRTTADELIDSGAPVDVVFPEKVVGVDLDSAINRETASPNSAKLFYNFLLSEKGQEAFVGSGASSPIGSEGAQPLPDEYVKPDYRDIPRTLKAAEKVLDLA